MLLLNTAVVKKEKTVFNLWLKLSPSSAVSRGRSSQHCHSSPGLLGCTVVVDHRATVGPPRGTGAAAGR